MTAIFKREFKSYFQNVIGWLFLAAVLALYGIYYLADNLIYGYAYISYPLQSATLIFLVAIPILTMRSMSEERKSRTDQLTMTAPISVGKLIIGKYLALVAVYTIEVALAALSCAVLSFFGTVSFSESALALLGFWLFGCAYLSIGLLISSLTESQVISAVLTFAVLFLTYMMDSICSLISSEGNWLTAFLGIFSFSTRYQTFLSGILDIKSIVYFLSVIALMLFLTCQSVQKRRWSVSRMTLSMGVFSGFYVVVSVALAVVVNLIVNQIPAIYTEFDCTFSQYYQITDDTYDVLDDLDTDITIYVYVAESDKSNYLIDRTLDYYDAASKHITVTYIDPNVNPTFMSQYTDAEASVASVVVESENRARFIDFYDMYEIGMDYSTYSYTYAYDVEGEVTSAIEYVTADEQALPVIYELTGHGETAMGSNFSDAVEKANITLESLELLNEETVPENASAIIINAPTSDFNEADAQKVIDYLQNGGKAIICGYYDSQGLTNFESILAAYDVTVTDGVIEEGDSNYYYYFYGPYYLFPDVAYTEYSSSVYGSTILYSHCEGFSYPVMGAEEDEEDDYAITYTPIMTTSDSAVLVPLDYDEETMSEDDLLQGPFTLALAVEQLLEDDSDMTQLVLVGTPAMFDDSYDDAVSNQNCAFFTDIISAFVGDVTLSTSVIPSKSMYMDNLIVGAAAIRSIGAFVVIIIPVALLAAGIAIWAIRRRK